MNVEIINVRDNGDYLTVTVKYDFGVEDTIDIPVSTDAQELNRILLKAYKECMEKHNKKRELLSILKGTIELHEEELEEAVEEVKEAVEETVEATENLIEKLVNDIKTKLEQLPTIDEDGLKRIADLIKQRPDLKSVIEKLVEKTKETIENIKITEDSEEGLPEASANFPWNLSDT